MQFADAIKAWASSPQAGLDKKTTQHVRKVWAAVRKSPAGNKLVGDVTNADINAIVAQFPDRQQVAVGNVLRAAGQWALQQPGGQFVSPAPGQPRPAAASPGPPAAPMYRDAPPRTNPLTVAVGVLAILALTIIGVVALGAIRGEADPVAAYCAEVQADLDRQPLLVDLRQFIDPSGFLQDRATTLDTMLKTPPPEIEADLRSLRDDVGAALQQLSQVDAESAGVSFGFGAPIELRNDPARDERLEDFTADRCGIDATTIAGVLQERILLLDDVQQQCLSEGVPVSGEDLTGLIDDDRLIVESSPVWDEPACAGRTYREVAAVFGMSPTQHSCLSRVEVFDDGIPETESPLWDDPVCGDALDAWTRSIYGVSISAIDAVGAG